MSKMISMKLTCKILIVLSVVLLTSISSLASENKGTNRPLVDTLDYNFFSPNNDSINDVFKFHDERVKVYGSLATLFIFNRWGDLVYKSDKIDPATIFWVGKINQGNKFLGDECPEGIYLYRLDYTILEKETSIQGTIALKR